MKSKNVKKNSSEKIFIVAVLAAVVLALGYFIFVRKSGHLPGQAVPIQGFEHIRVGGSHPPYNSLPPTSGWHYEATSEWGIHEEPVANEVQVHNLEHGGIMVQYKPGIDAAVIEKLKPIVSNYKSKVILAPYHNLDTNIALTAWGRIDKFDGFDEGRIKRFIDAFRNKGPERVPD